MKSNKTLFLVEVAVLAALAYLLDLVSTALFSRIWAQGGSVSLAMVPVFLIAYRWGIKGGLLTGFLLGLLQFISGFAQIYHPVQGFIDYFVAFTVVGFAGVVASEFKNAVKNRETGKWMGLVVLSTFLGSLLRFLAHFYTGNRFLWFICAKRSACSIIFLGLQWNVYAADIHYQCNLNYSYHFCCTETDCPNEEIKDDSHGVSSL